MFTDDFLFLVHGNAVKKILAEEMVRACSHGLVGIFVGNYVFMCVSMGWERVYGPTNLKVDVVMTSTMTNERKARRGHQL